MEIEEIKKEYQQILKKLSDPGLISNLERLEELSKKKNQLEKIIEKERELKEIENKIEENQLIIAAKEDPELCALAEGEMEELYQRKKILEKEIAELLKEKKEEPSAIVVEIRAGAGGEEAALFVADLYRMYCKYATSQNWKLMVLDSHPTQLGGFKEIIFELKNGEVFEKMQFEGGVHRVQRIPLTEKAGRIHTSTATVAILPKPKISQIKIRPQDLKIEFYRASGPGGQYVNRRETAVRITHLPSGLTVSSQVARTQKENKEYALSILKARLLEKKRLKEEEKIKGKRRAQIGWAMRAEKIRTYNFPQNRLTDHRIKKSWHNLEEIMEGKLQSVIEVLVKSLK